MKITLLAILIIIPAYSAYTKGKCNDLRQGCANWKRRGWCTSRPSTMKKICSATCDFCTDQCKDERKDCHYLRSLGWCKYQHKAMLKACPRACLFCKKNKPSRSRIIPSTPKPTQATKESEYVKAKLAKTRAVNCVDSQGTTRCQYYKYIGWCEKNRNMKHYCRKTCFCDRKIRKPVCQSTKYGCCWDNKTSKVSRSGIGCPQCKDDKRFMSLCRRFKSDCRGKGGLGESLRKYCLKTCQLC